MPVVHAAAGAGALFVIPRFLSFSDAYLFSSVIRKGTSENYTKAVTCVAGLSGARMSPPSFAAAAAAAAALFLLLPLRASLAAAALYVGYLVFFASSSSSSKNPFENDDRKPRRCDVGKI